MSEREPFIEPERSTAEILYPDERGGEAFPQGEPVVGFVSVSRRVKQLREGVSVGTNPTNGRVRIRFDADLPIPNLPYAAGRPEAAVREFSLQDIHLLRRRDYEYLRENPETIDEWLARGYSFDESDRRYMRGKLQGVGIEAENVTIVTDSRAAPRMTQRRPRRTTG